MPEARHQKPPALATQAPVATAPPPSPAQAPPSIEQSPPSPAQSESPAPAAAKVEPASAVFEGSREADGSALSFDIEADQKPSAIHVRLLPDGTVAILDDSREVTHETVVYELDLTGRT